MSIVPQTVGQAVPPVIREGLPYWTFWLLLCLILLLLAFIFLRDKDLRRRLNVVLSGPKRRLIRTRLRMLVARAKRRRADLQADLGKAAWQARVEPARFEADFRHLERLDRALSLNQDELAASRARKSAVQSRLERARPRGDDPPPKADPETSSLKKELKVLKKRVEAGESEARRLEAERRARYASLGEKIDELRPDLPDFAPLFARIDKLNREIMTHLDRIERLA